jgi:CRISPR-associated protein Cas2
MDKGYSFYLIAYDISKNRTRAKLARYLESLGARVQGSVFEIYLNEQLLKQVMKKCKPWIKEEDSLRIYPLCSTCCGMIKIIGKGNITPGPELIIV